MKKALWETSMSKGSIDDTIKLATTVGADLVCIRTTSAALPAAIPLFHKHGIKVYGWRWPAVKPKQYNAPHYYALAEAGYVAGTLIPAGLDGYIVDPESDGAGEDDDWNSAAHKDLATQFCSIIKTAAAGSAFHFGVTSGCQYPTNHKQIPWAAFVEASDALYPQTYWRHIDGKTKQPADVHGGTPAESLERATKSWSTIAAGKPLVAIGGEIGVLGDRPGDIKTFADLVANKQEFVHFYAASASTPPAVLDRIAKL